MDVKKIGWKIRTAREKKAILLSTVAGELALEEGQLTRLETGLPNGLTPEQIIAWAQLVDLDPHEIGLDPVLDKTIPQAFWDLIKVAKTARKPSSAAPHGQPKTTRVERMETLENELFHPERLTARSPKLFWWVAAALGLLYGLAVLSTNVVVSNLSLSMLGPFVLLWFFFENCRSREVKGSYLLFLFFFAGIGSILLVLFFRDYVGYPDIPFLEDLLTGLLEEFTKILIVFMFAWWVKVKNVQTGILLGFAVGAGFDAFETAEYGIFTLMEEMEFEPMQGVLWTRSLYAVLGIGHHYWTGMLSGALFSVNRTGYLKLKDFKNGIFWIWFGIVVVLHALNNFSNTFDYGFFLGYVIAAGSLGLFLLMWNKARQMDEGLPHRESAVPTPALAEMLVLLKEEESPPETAPKIAE